jgi:predicted RNase H-like HicB family nuclease
MSKAEKLFEKLMSGKKDANFSLDDLCSLLTKLGYTARKPKRQPPYLPTGVKFSESPAQHRRQSKVLSSPASSPGVAKIESQTIMKTVMRPDARDYEIRIWYSAEKGDECFVAQVVEWPGVMAHGDTREEAARQIQLALEGALEVAAEQGIQPPAPALAHA